MAVVDAMAAHAPSFGRVLALLQLASQVEGAVACVSSGRLPGVRTARALAYEACSADGPCSDPHRGTLLCGLAAARLVRALDAAEDGQRRRRHAAHGMGEEWRRRHAAHGMGEEWRRRMAQAGVNPRRHFRRPITDVSVAV